MRIGSTWKQSILFIAIAATVAGCSGGGGGSEQVNPDDTSVALSNATIIYSKQPRINEALTLSVKQQAGASQSYTWSVVSQPVGSALAFTPKQDINGVEFTPVVGGNYQLKVSSDAGATTIDFYINPRFSFATDKVSLYEGSFTDATYVGRVSNQVWLYSLSPTQTELEQIANQYPAFQVIGFDSVNGLLLQFDETNPENLTAIKDMRLLPGVASVDYRIVTGDMFVQPPEVTPDDGSNFDDGGDNWHLERIGAQQAWDITTGSAEFTIGISESVNRYSINHEDLIGRFKSAQEALPTDVSHASSVAGVIGANTDNGVGMSGVNWMATFDTAQAGADGLRQLAISGSNKVINGAWGMMFPPFAGTDLNDTTVEPTYEDRAFDLTRVYRKLMAEYANQLFVHSAGNGTDGPDGTGFNGRFHSPAMQYTEIGTLDPLPNVLFVGALHTDGKLLDFSNYGESVDIAAPARFKSIDGLDGYDTFGGTSSASAVVTGVASLIYSVNKDFTASTVKSILIESATEFVTERHTESSNDGVTETLSHPIPIVNAAAALRLAADLNAGLKAEVKQSFDNPFANITNVRVVSANGEFQTRSFTYSLNRVPRVASGSEVELTIDDPTAELRMTNGQAKFLHRLLDTTTTAEFSTELQNPNIALNLFDKNSYLPVTNAEITIEPLFVRNARFDSATGFGGTDGQTRLYLMSGFYKVFVTAAGYSKYRTLIYVKNDGQRTFINFPMTAVSDPIDPVGVGLDACLIGKWSLDTAHLREQLGPSLVIFGESIVTVKSNGAATTDSTLTYTASNDVNGQSQVSTVTQTITSKFEWRTTDNVFFVESRGQTIRSVSSVTIDGVTVPGASDEPPVSVTSPGNSSAPYTCVGDVWIVEAAGENTLSTRLNRL